MDCENIVDREHFLQKGTPGRKGRNLRYDVCARIRWWISVFLSNWFFPFPHFLLGLVLLLLRTHQHFKKKKVVRIKYDGSDPKQRTIWLSCYFFLSPFRMCRKWNDQNITFFGFPFLVNSTNKPACLSVCLSERRPVFFLVPILRVGTCTIDRVPT